MADILVTGGAGYVGSHACKALAQAGHRPITYDNLLHGHRELVKWGPLEEGDVTDPAGLAAVFAKYKPAAVMHFAALTAVGESTLHPEKYHHTNVHGTHCVLAEMRKAGVDKLVLSSTCSVYAQTGAASLNEDTPLGPNNPYGVTKRLMEQAAAEAAAAGWLSWVALRYFNAAGADPGGETGEWHEPETHLIPRTLAVADGAADVLPVYGDTYATPDGTCVRDYVHVADIASAHVRAFDYLATRRGGHIFNLGNARGYSVREVIRTAEDVTGRVIATRLEPARAGDVPVLVADAARARDVLGWRPQYPDLRRQIADAWGWQHRLK